MNAEQRRGRKGGGQPVEDRVEEDVQTMLKMGTIRITPPLIGCDTVTPDIIQLPLNNELDGN